MLAPSTVLLAIVASLTLGIDARPSEKPTRRSLAGWGYATFYNDNACTQGAGQAVSMGNQGCLAESGRNSIYVQPGDNDDFTGAQVSLVFSPGADCSCQNDCTEVSYNAGVDFCMDLNGHASAESFRFIDQGCGGNNC